MNRLAAVRIAAGFAALATSGGACHDDSPSRGRDDAAAAAAADGGVTDVAPVNALDFTVAGCPKFDRRLPQCQGAAPLTITFAPVTSNGFLRFQWAFGDGTSVSAEATPTHTYTTPGLYDVTLRGVGAPGSVSEVVSRPRTAFVQVTANPLGGSCDLDVQCDQGLGCVCGPQAGCGGAFVRGICTSACGDDCKARGSSTCVDLGLASAAAGARAWPWQRRLCLPACVSDKDCETGRTCRDLPDGDRPGTWTRACFVATPSPVGAACRSAEGDLQNATCATGLCADLGARGVCSHACSASSCPPGSSCAALNGGRMLCLRPCGGGEVCDADPLLACEAPRNAGPLGFVVRDHVPGTTYCAPKRCNGNTDCGPAGRCQEDPQGAHCVRRGS